MDLSVSFEANQASGQSSQTEDNIGMEPGYYKAAEEGKIEDFKNIEQSDINRFLTPNRNTVLHLYLTSLKDSELSTVFVEEILGMCPPLLQQANVKGETPLHIAARYGHAAIVDVLIKRARERAPQEDLENGVNNPVQKMLEMTNKVKDTALHEAVRGNHLKVVKRLIQEGEDFSYSQNDAGETPLYIAVERNYKEVAFHILDTCTSPAHDGPLGRTTLHAAVIVHNDVMVERILQGKTQEEKRTLSKQDDKQRWTPLHCAAYFGSCALESVLLEVGRSIAYMKDAKGMTALHIAAHRGHCCLVDEILKYCPDCCELVDERGWNVLHFVVNSPSSIWADHGAKYFLKQSSLSSLLNEKDARGNTPLHHHSKSLHYIKDVVCHSRVDRMALNKNNLNAYDVALTSEELSDTKYMQITRAFYDNGLRPELRRPLEDDILSRRKDCVDVLWRLKVSKSRKDRFVSGMKEASQYHLVVDILIVTVAFTAGITMPGGFRGHDGPHPGSAVLTGNAAFKAFVIANTIAMVQSCSAAFIHLFMPLLFHDKDLVGDFSFLLASLAFCLSISAMGAMMLAFVLGTCAVLMHSLNLAIANSVIGLCFFIPLVFVSIGCSQYFHELWSIGLAWFFENVFMVIFLLCESWYYALKDRFWHLRKSQRSRNDAGQPTAS